MQQAKMHRVRSHVSGTPILAEYDQLETKCINKYMAYSAQGFGKLTTTVISIWIEWIAPIAEVSNLVCVFERKYPKYEYFLLAGGEPTVGQHTVAIESKIECQLDNATMKFDFWTNSNGPILRQCIIKQNGDLECQDILPMPNPVNFSIPHSADPFRVRIEVINVRSQDIVLIDNLYYEGRICELSTISIYISSFRTNLINSFQVDDNESTYSVIPTNQRSSPTFKASGLEEFLTEEKSSTATVLSKNHLGVLKVVSIDGSTDEDDTIEVLTTPQQTSELSVCEALSCDFNSQHPCFYGYILILSLILLLSDGAKFGYKVPHVYIWRKYKYFHFLS
uniref:MAM domain-containing protein n=1 Tax=Heterorhabditis bacteriophora TaxID=37862 RepID=A0A1I7X1T3_HETBA